MKADLARLMLLQKLGGIWANLRLEPTGPFPEELLSYEAIVVEHFPRDNLPNPNGILANGLYRAACPNCPVIANALRLAVTNVLQKNGKSVFGITGFRRI